MPFVHIRIAGGDFAAAQVQQLQTVVTQLMAEIMGKKADLTAVLVEHTADTLWSIGGEPVSVAAHLDVKVTAGTNTPEEKAAFVAAASQLFKDTLGPNLPLATYVVVHEIEANAWGYDGRTQQARRASAPVAPRSVERAIAPRSALSDTLMAVVRLLTFSRERRRLS
ncbi:4-oxalocrotonate tautomerase [Rhizobium subbaraonis]|uniref:4-oxalocrotonate tautomerase n=1 Tax=Rhizobium subbaraonis TaxID=908946 RepID=A0A285UMZ5_9HYPH|nr:tautomerase family protein [Rhizobium subbaraonis]SOC42758.1 4-oxalocrotonate tautomerase [Rhizobium subbaraonis]